MIQNHAYLIRRNGIFYFSRRVPADVRSRFNKDRVIFSQKSSDIFGALIIIPILGQMLHFYLDGLVWRFRDPTIRERNHRFLVS